MSVVPTKIQSLSDGVSHLNCIIVKVNQINGWFDKTRVVGDSVSLIHTEVSELYEWTRKGYQLPSDHIPEFSGEEEELADILIRVLDYEHRHVKKGRLVSAVLAKLRYNETRGYRHGGKVV